MARTTPDARQRLVIGAADMIRRRGLSATSVRDLAVHAEAPLGSTYHYFPGGKQQLAVEAIQYAGDTVTRVLGRALEAGPVEGLRAFLALWRDVVISTDFAAGCPVLAVAVEEPTDGDLVVREAAAAFASWESLLAKAMRGRGVSRKQAEQVATLIVAAVEGTVAMCRAKRTVEPLDHVSAQLEAIVVSAIPPLRR
jgi:AcrR family transcriptional regulator